jgi:hypothetical protein
MSPEAVQANPPELQVDISEAMQLRQCVQSASARKQLTALVLIGLNRMASSFAEFEHAMIHEWTTAWLAGARCRKLGRSKPVQSPRLHHQQWQRR